MGLMRFTRAALRNLFSKPVTTQYPFVPREYPERTRGHVELDFDSCVLCGSCARHCPTGTIVVDRKAGTWSIGRMDCVQCGNCVLNCPKKCLTIVPGYATPGPEKTTDTFTRPVESGGEKKPAVDADACKYCGLCAKKCPQGAITVDRKAKSWELNGDACVGCGICVENCHFKAISMQEQK